MEDPTHIVHEAHGDYKERMSSGNFLYYIFGGLVLAVLGLILFGYSTGIVDRALFILVIVVGVFIMWKGVIPSKKKKYKQTAHRISFG